ncbi:3-dehydroquinate synthase [Lentilactobacillus curieae]|uniref:3-dehydroquinate synthase n=1 Tax=Lentilactobacillus curieae TaxID=1138822 RepID=A0A1S6QHT9_9LACO|nr:3-dehydroquinate synthase [Lentilactobacillus curieae]AQW21172.1 3-dehydroquinate synthase [Lentilactobacillus curieae]
MEILDVNIPSHPYQVKIGRNLLASTGSLVASVWQPRKVALISDDNVAPLYQEKVAESLTKSGFTVCAYRFPAGEQSKSLDVLGELATQMTDDGFNRDDGVIALGGGVTGDLAGFVAASYMRGLPLIQIPTSFLAQVDSSVGGKTAVDLGTTKNILGAFLQPDLVIVDPETLKTLDQRDLVEGYGEVVKVAGLTDHDIWSLVKMINSPTDILKNSEKLSELAIKYKAEVVEADEKEGGLRQVLNFGHTIGHAVEALSDGKLRHGEAVAIGMVAISQVFTDHGLTPATVTEQLKERLASVNLPVEMPSVSPKQVLAKVKNDKKNHDGKLNLVFLKEIGGPAIKSVDLEDVADFLGLTSDASSH